MKSNLINRQTFQIPKLQSDGTPKYALFGRSSNNEILPSAITNNAHYPELEKLSNKVNKAFKKREQNIY